MNRHSQYHWSVFCVPRRDRQWRCSAMERKIKYPARTSTHRPLDQRDDRTASFEQRRDTNKYISGRIQPLYNPSTGLNNIINNSINYIFLRYRCFVIHVALPRAKKQKQEPPKPSYHDVTLPQKQQQQHRPNLSHHMSAKKEKHVRHAATWFAGVSAYAPGDAQ
jgi:hypothetical protein